MLALFHDKKCCNCFNLYPCTLWHFIVLDLVLSWWRLKLKWRISGFCEKLSRKRATWGAHDWKLKSHARLLFSQVSRNILPEGFLSVTSLPFTYCHALNPTIKIGTWQPPHTYKVSTLQVCKAFLATKIYFLVFCGILLYWV